ncbi:MAG: carboxylesterase family protein [Acidimicrobiia bacterium]|nr:carboxylesterase family protein [Acidimicrobiia bacterium]
MTAPTVAVTAGRIEGSSVGGSTGRAPGEGRVLRFLGVPYAAAPVGDLRWRAPQACVSWAGTRRALEFAPVAPQRAALESRLPGFRPDQPTGEDCLALNVWTPGLDGDRPVLVWFPGGAYLSGGTAQPVYDGAALAAQGNAVVVTVGYRLGALGFLAPVQGDGRGDAVANCGLRDQLAALAWIHEHASAFGGDPGRITVMGESAGAGSILHLLASPIASGAFGRAIVQSGEPRTLGGNAAQDVASVFARHLGLDRSDIEALRVVPVGALLDAQDATQLEVLGRVGPMPFAPMLDGEVCDTEIVDALRGGRSADVDLVIGTTRDELALFPDPRADALDDTRLARRVAHLLAGRGDPEAAVATYRTEQERDGRAVTNGAVWDAVRTDAMMRVPALGVADSHSAAGGSTWVYRFDWEAPGLGAAHGVDLPFTFATFDREGWGTVVGSDDRAEALGVAWREAWLGFAAVGDPGNRTFPWPRHDVATRPTRLFGPDGPTLVDDPAGAIRRIWMAAG